MKELELAGISSHQLGHVLCHQPDVYALYKHANLRKGQGGEVTSRWQIAPDSYVHQISSITDVDGGGSCLDPVKSHETAVQEVLYDHTRVRSEWQARIEQNISNRMPFGCPSLLAVDAYSITCELAETVVMHLSGETIVSLT